MDTSKFFNRKSGARDPKSPYKKGKFVSESNRYTSRIGSRIEQTPLTKSLFSVRKKVFQIENTLNSIFNLNKKSSNVKQRFELVEYQETRDKKKSISAPNLGGIIQRPKTGALDFISNFLTFTFLGWLFTVLQPLIGKLEGLFPILQGAFDFLGGTVKFLIDGFASFIKIGYDVHDEVKKGHNEMEKLSSRLQNTFNEATETLEQLIDGTVKLATSFLDVFKEPYGKIDVKNGSSDAPVIGTFSSLASTAPAMVTKFQSGGEIGEGRIDAASPIERGVRKLRKKERLLKPTTQVQQTIPGKDVGGNAKIKTLYGEREESLSFFPGSLIKTKTQSGFSALNKASEEYKKPKSDDVLGIGNLMGATIDTTLGQRIESKTYKQFADGINYLADFKVNNPEEFSKINLERMIRDIVEPKVDQAINKIREELSKKSFSESGGGSFDADGDFPSGFVTSVNVEGFSEEDVDALGRMIQAEAGNQSNLGKAGVLSVILNRYRLIKSGVATPGQFAISGKTKDEVTIRDILFAGGTGSQNQFSPYKDGSFARTSSAAGKAALAAAIGSGGNNPQKFRENLISQGLSEVDSDYVVRSVFFSNRSSRSSRPDTTREVSIGDHVFQQSRSVKLTGEIGEIGADVKFDIDGENAILAKLGSSNKLVRTRSGLCVNSVLKTLEANGIPNPFGTGNDDGNNPRGLMVQLMKNYGWSSLPYGRSQALESPYGKVAANVMSLNEYKTLVESGKIPSGSIVFQTRHNTWNGTSSGSRGFDSAIARNGGKNLWNGSMQGMSIYGNSTKNVVVLVPGGSVRTTEDAQIKEKSVLAIRDSIEGIVEDGKWTERKWSDDERRRYNIQKSSAARPKPVEAQTDESSQTPQTQRRRSRRGSGVFRESEPEKYMVRGKMYNFDFNKNIVTDEGGNRIEVGPGKNEWLLKEVYQLRNKKKYGGLVYSNSSTPTLPVEKYASYNNPAGGGMTMIQPVIIPQPVATSGESSGIIAFAIPRVNSSSTTDKLVRS